MSYLSKSDLQVLKQLRLRIRALNHPLRQRILATIKKHNNKYCVTDIYRSVKVEQSVASQHLAILRRAGFVTTLRSGKTIYYQVNEAGIKSFIEARSALI